MVKLISFFSAFDDWICEIRSNCVVERETHVSSSLKLPLLYTAFGKLIVFISNEHTCRIPQNERFTDVRVCHQSADVCEQILRVVSRSSRLEELVLDNAGLKTWEHCEHISIKSAESQGKIELGVSLNSWYQSYLYWVYTSIMSSLWHSAVILPRS